ncbi:MAG: phage tail assembly protein [Pseudomonas sp.]|uniref:phage tail assembly protein n=1 Tax=Pseudomonas sp. TaxID=306 RepID=UPI0032426D3A|tara:strand:- start:15308 stop:15598 length:291 start_codon:yes stop_codon:yes gene_type:complete
MAKAAPTTEVVTLETPLQRGEQTITKVTLRKPATGELRGVHLAELIQLDVSSLSRVIPRISDPTLTEQDVAKMDPADAIQMGLVVAGFLAPKAVTE